jgi:RHH-type proline utilization regulon transcriptional repressor/proline dehydrogenase/delta 1-pyrroline-5-carboxylate dehydrogenase
MDVHSQFSVMSLKMEPDTTSLERAIRRIGESLDAQCRDHKPTVFSPRRWSNALLNQCMKDETFKVQLFRFIDVLPSLQNDEQVARLLEEYFGKSMPMESVLQWGMKALSATSLGAKLGAKSIRHQVLSMARSFMAGGSVTDAIPTLGELWSHRLGYSVDLLGEATVNEREADLYRDRCLEALQQLHRESAKWPTDSRLEHDHLGTIPRTQLSLKISALYSQIDPAAPEASYAGVAARLRPILNLAMRLPASITFDMEQAELKDFILMMFMRVLSEETYRSYPYAGIAMQAYMHDTPKDLAHLIEWVRHRGVPTGIRLVKGAYWDADTIRYRQRAWPLPVLEQKSATDAQYEALTRVLLRHTDVIRPAFGTHNLRSVAHAQAAAEAAGLPMEACEFQMIFGMAEPLQAAVAAGGYRVRIYTPVGDLLPGMAYLVRRLLENTSNESFLRKQYAEAESLESLLAPPVAEPQPSESASHDMQRETAFQNEPPTDFSRTSAQRAMQEAIKKVEARLGKTVSPPWPTPFRTGVNDCVSRDPGAPTRVVGRVPETTPQDLSSAVEEARTGFRLWSSRSPVDRAEVLVTAARLMRARRMELAAWETFEAAKGWREADSDVTEAIDFLEFYAREMRRLATPQRLGLEPGELNQLHWHPRGLTAVIPPWNFPLAIPTGMVSAALVTGNAVLFKPSERTPMMGYHLASIFKEAGLPRGVLQFLPGGPDLGRALVRHPDVQIIAFTGSRSVGLTIMADAAQVPAGSTHVKRVIAEMGGKNAIIVDDSADLDEAVTGVITSFTGFQGQKCSACSRAIVLGPVYDTFLQRLADAVMSLRIGPAQDPASQVGPVIDERARRTIQEYIEIGKREARLVVERPVPSEGFYVSPTVFADVPANSRLAQEEIFGPVLAVMPARTFEEALALANATPYALTGGVYSRSPVNLELAQRQFDVGNLYLNRAITGALVGQQPFGGHRLSGVGAKAGGEHYLTQFMTARVVTENTLRRGFAPSAND